MDLSASDIYSLQLPSRCGLRVYLLGKDVPQAPPGELTLTLRKLGIALEQAHLETLGNFASPDGTSQEARATDTVRLVNERTPVIYQPVLMAGAPEGMAGNRIVGIPDLLLLEGEGYRIRDVKLARHVGEGRHDEIVAQVSLYGWLFTQSFGVPPVALEVALGDGSLVQLPDDGGVVALKTLEEVLGFMSLSEEPYEPVGWSKCGDCGYKERCWDPAMERVDAATLAGVDQGLAKVLREQGVVSVPQLLERHDASTLSALQRPWGKRTQRVGDSGARRILAHAQARLSDEVVQLAPSEFPVSPNYVVFDIEGMPPYADGADQAYLWGIQVFGDDPGPFIPAVADFDADGDRQGWFDFLDNCRAVFSEHGDLPFLHWASYEKTKVNLYLERYGDKDGTGVQVLTNLTDLLAMTQRAFALPDPTYSLKVLEQRAGYNRTMEEYGGDWAIVQYLEARESPDEEHRKKIIDDIVKYNREDLEATWAVFQWLRNLSST